MFVVADVVVDVVVDVVDDSDVIVVVDDCDDVY